MAINIYLTDDYINLLYVSPDLAKHRQVQPNAVQAILPTLPFPSWDW